MNTLPKVLADFRVGPAYGDKSKYTVTRFYYPSTAMMGSPVTYHDTAEEANREAFAEQAELASHEMYLDYRVRDRKYPLEVTVQPFHPGQTITLDCCDYQTAWMWVELHTYDATCQQKVLRVLEQMAPFWSRHGLRCRPSRIGDAALYIDIDVRSEISAIPPDVKPFTYVEQAIGEHFAAAGFTIR